MVKEIDLEAGTRLRLEEIHSIELVPREGEKSALHYITVGGVRFNIYEHENGTVNMSIHGMKKYGKGEITIFNPDGKVSKKTYTVKKSSDTYTDIQII
tara:strand:+ start:836 stop:1129 length:294 start_codon:yes stop_codon:yes gene_type:complete